MNVAPRIQRALRAKKLKQIDLARRIGVAPSTVHAWVHGNAYPRLATLERIARELDTTVSFLVREDRTAATSAASLIGIGLPDAGDERDSPARRRTLAAGREDTAGASSVSTRRT
ncbi:MAG: helix-turn-helix transcriptional regulator [Deltaproteobacteria bacterium]|nr:MAG: helix-turn-helix transcriptional regulator [Deltaproteobacteria bacterium]TMQ23086.1 MAG: helix-turn-helix transcriptional regulator [Deltaproteobacteria bacterium]